MVSDNIIVTIEVTNHFWRQRKKAGSVDNFEGSLVFLLFIPASFSFCVLWM